jgi:hypothetical protein
MLVGHFGIGFLAKRTAPRVSLGTLVFAAMLADVLWCVFMLAGVEHVRFNPGRGAANYLDAVDVAYSHGLLTLALWGAILASLYWLKRRDRWAAWVLFVVVLSHWFLDFVSHNPDMPIAPGLPGRFGLGLWKSIPGTLIVEGGLWVIAVVVYARATRARSLLGTLLLWSVAALLVLPWRENISGPPPRDVFSAGVNSLIFFSLVIAWSYGVSRLRPVRQDAEAVLPDEAVGQRSR